MARQFSAFHRNSLPRKMSDNSKKTKKRRKKEIIISNDNWLKVFDLLSPRQLGLKIALLSRRFDFFVDEHFKLRRWALSTFIRIGWMEIGCHDDKAMKIYTSCEPYQENPLPDRPLPNKIVGFKCVYVSHIDRDAVILLRRFSRLFASCAINLKINIDYDGPPLLAFFLRNIMPMLNANICGLDIGHYYHRLRPFLPSILRDFCPALRFVDSLDIFPEFPPAVDENSANASGGQMIAKWLFTPRPDGAPKVFRCVYLSICESQLPSKIDALKAAFVDASSPVSFIILLWGYYGAQTPLIVPFELINECTNERLALRQFERVVPGTVSVGYFLLFRSPIARNEQKWAIWVKEAIKWAYLERWNIIVLHINSKSNNGFAEIKKILRDASPGPSQEKKRKMNE